MSRNHYGNQSQSTETDEDPDSINRRRFVKSVGAAGAMSAAGGVFSVGTSDTHSAQGITTESHLSRLIPDEELYDLSQSITGKLDVQNVMNLVPGYSQLIEEAIDVQAAEHTLENGNALTTVAYALPDDNVLAYHEFDTPEVMQHQSDEPEARLKTQANVFSIEGEPLTDASLVKTHTSANGGVLTAMSSAVNCSCFPEGNETSGARAQDCARYDLDCLYNNAGGVVCAAVCAGSRAACVACLIAAIGAGQYVCCAERETTCISCNP